MSRDHWPHTQRILWWAPALVSMCFVTLAHSDAPVLLDPITVSAASSPTQEIIYAATLGGPNWEGFSRYYAANYQLGFFVPQLPIYLTSVDIGDDEYAFFPANQYLSAQPWYSSTLVWTVQTIVNSPRHLYGSCGAGNYSFDVAQVVGNGELELADDFGGQIEDAKITLENTHNGVHRSIGIRFIRPGQFYNPDQCSYCSYCPIIGGCEISLGEEKLTEFDGPLGTYVPVRTIAVQIATPDAPPASPGQIDASDVAAMAPHVGQLTSWGRASDPAGSLNCNFDWAINPFPYAQSIDMSDVSWLSYSLGVPKRCCSQGGYPCNYSKAGSDAEADAIRHWFGLAPTGRQLQVSGQSIPEVTIADPSAWQTAVADPYGYRQRIQGENTPWSKVKTLYR